jgi:hypothetical protein
MDSTQIKETPSLKGDGVSAGVVIKSVITPQDFLPGRSSDWARLRFAGLERGKELVVGKMRGVVDSAEERAPSIEGGWRGKARSIIWLHGSFEMTARLDSQGGDPSKEKALFPGLVECRIDAPAAILPRAFTQHALRAFDAGKKKLEFEIDVCLQATGKASPSSSPYVWVIVSWVDDDRAFRMRAGRPMDGVHRAMALSRRLEERVGPLRNRRSA